MSIPRTVCVTSGWNCKPYILRSASPIAATGQSSVAPTRQTRAAMLRRGRDDSSTPARARPIQPTPPLPCHRADRPRQTRASPPARLGRPSGGRAVGAHSTTPSIGLPIAKISGLYAGASGVIDAGRTARQNQPVGVLQISDRGLWRAELSLGRGGGECDWRSGGRTVRQSREPTDAQREPSGELQRL